MKQLDFLIKLLNKLPGVGYKKASSLAMFLLKSEDNYLTDLASTLASLKSQIKACDICGCYNEGDNCAFCHDSSRNFTVICVVEHENDAINIEENSDYDGLYHVLGGVIAPLDGYGIEDLRFKELFARITSEVSEVIIATSLTLEGDTTANYLKSQLEKNENITITRIAGGMPAGLSLEHADNLTLKRSLNDRKSFL